MNVVVYYKNKLSKYDKESFVLWAKIILILIFSEHPFLPTSFAIFHHTGVVCYCKIYMKQLIKNAFLTGLI